MKHLMRFSSKKLHAFTLAETIIVLAIIGIIAVFTIPALFQAFKTSVYKSGFSKSKTAVSSAMSNLMLLENASGNIYETSIAFCKDKEQLQAMNCYKDASKSVFNMIRDDVTNTEFKSSIETMSYEATRNHIEYYVGLPQPAYADEGSGTEPVVSPNVWTQADYVFQVLDGSLYGYAKTTAEINLYANDEGNINNEYVFLAMADSNGFNGPNVIGLDMFYFLIDSRGTVHNVTNYFIEKRLGPLESTGN